LNVGHAEDASKSYALDLGSSKTAKERFEEGDSAMDAPLDPYVELGVTRSSSRADVTDAYHHLVRQHHPDSRPPGVFDAASDSALMRIMAAYRILEDPKRRDEYDREHPEPVPASYQNVYQPMIRIDQPMIWIAEGELDQLRVGPVRWH
jgi:DnaJ-class molecular chaperone